MVKVTFKYRDRFNRPNWSTQSCVVDSVNECKMIYGLGIDPDCEYEIISVEDVDSRE